MISLITASKAQRKLAENARLKRLDMNLTQAGLAERSGVPLPTLRKFEQKGSISLESFLKLYVVLGGLVDMLEVLETPPQTFSSIDEVLEEGRKPARQRGSKK